ncbi:hypothetical protein DPPLL_09320 [Desulfofustis limnaeus]|uniref:Uncharacterized protein n=1 Tax=Desulfofustis limnaeus TaxID=2740163 RepID=A0ABM7W6J0_9BACT|nr:hypothetical protein DPPLL_09320 [Desulfofustis limnaeus]
MGSARISTCDRCREELQRILVNRRHRPRRAICRGRRGGSGSLTSETAMVIDCDRDMKYIQAHV